VKVSNVGLLKQKKMQRTVFLNIIRNAVFYLETKV